jgi:hypothetical protein
MQGGSMPPFLICLSLNPISAERRYIRMTPGYSPKLTLEIGRLTHVLYMGDLKLYSSSLNSLESLINSVRHIPLHIGMEFRIDKCSQLHRKRRQIVTRPNLDPVLSLFKKLDVSSTYKDLGFSQLNRSEDFFYFYTNIQLIQKFEISGTKSTAGK